MPILLNFYTRRGASLSLWFFNKNRLSKISRLYCFNVRNNIANMLSYLAFWYYKNVLNTNCKFMRFRPLTNTWILKIQYNKISTSLRSTLTFIQVTSLPVWSPWYAFNYADQYWFLYSAQSLSSVRLTCA